MLQHNVNCWFHQRSPCAHHLYIHLQKQRLIPFAVSLTAHGNVLLSHPPWEKLVQFFLCDIGLLCCFINLLLFLQCRGTEDEDEEQRSVASEKKFIVYESCLQSLLSVFLLCQTVCTVTVRNCVGTMVTLKSTCANGHQRLWYSQPSNGNMPWREYNMCCRDLIYWM